MVFLFHLDSFKGKRFIHLKHWIVSDCSMPCSKLSAMSAETLEFASRILLREAFLRRAMSRLFAAPFEKSTSNASRYSSD